MWEKKHALCQFNAIRYRECHSSLSLTLQDQRAGNFHHRKWPYLPELYVSTPQGERARAVKPFRIDKRVEEAAIAVGSGIYEFVVAGK